ncbi:DUF1214 domain-containing protein [Mycolicibacterium flavescens]|uniref:DUF1214 domain-containing protein n=1 Tax=Mycolicibacterium flavescens TaxID=1776 RepID=A0A1E3RSX7_MYCFV|nr:DUF1214 domain-containing protein [Mycolicibacterium flavescens]ODQ92542.1 hypothetical protein BHQ18_02130 [Mycolicibacterium flavescens]
MATTPNSYARFVGRVGALAVALGVGAAVATTPGFAVADDTGADTSEAADAGAAGTDTSPDSVVGGNLSDNDDAGEDEEEEAEDDESEDDEALDDEALDDTAEDDEPVEPKKNDDDPAPVKRTGDREPAVTFSGNVSRTTETTPEPTPDPVEDIATDLGAPVEEESPVAEAAVAPVTSEPPATAAVTAVPTVVGSMLSALGFGPLATQGPAVPTPSSPLLWAMLGFARREIGNTPAESATATPTAAALVVATETVSPLATPEQLAAERIAARTVRTLPVILMKMVLRQQFLAAAQRLYPDGIDAENMAALNRAVDEYAMGAAFQQQLLDSMNPKVVAQVAPPHVWFGQAVPGSRILYDNPDTIYRFMGVNGASEYVITGRFHDMTADGRPSDTTFSVLEGVGGTTSAILTADDLEVNEDGTFTITVSREPANGRRNHLQLTTGSTIIAARDTLGDWNSEVPVSLSIERVGGPPNSLFAQIGGFAFLGQFVSGNPLLTTLVSVVPPLPYMPPLLRGAFTAVILVVRGAAEQAKYMALATTDSDTGAPRPVNEIGQPASNAEFLANQLQSNGHFQLADDEVLVLTIDPGDAGYFIVPTYNIWTITDDYWSEPGSLNNEQAVRNADGTYTVVISPTDPGAANWVSTSGLNQGAIAIRFQDLGLDAPRIVSQQVMSHEALRDHLPAAAFVTPEERAAQLALRQAGFDSRWS